MVIVLTGAYDLDTMPKLRRELERVATGARAIVDLSRVTYVDSGFIAELIKLNTKRTEDGLSPITLVAGRETPAVWKVFEICGIAMECRVVDSAPSPG